LADANDDRLDTGREYPSARLNLLRRSPAIPTRVPSIEINRSEMADCRQTPTEFVFCMLFLREKVLFFCIIMTCSCSLTIHIPVVTIQFNLPNYWRFMRKLCNVVFYFNNNLSYALFISIDDMFLKKSSSYNYVPWLLIRKLGHA